MTAAPAPQNAECASVEERPGDEVPRHPHKVHNEVAWARLSDAIASVSGALLPRRREQGARPMCGVLLLARPPRARPRQSGSPAYGIAVGEPARHGRR